ncbi:putative Inner membrane protein YebE [Rubrivivax sp. A210]|uniref:tellurite resistance TerB family protein n=1 Tax=Rubrivivax sp. A210 TaxID=2772301 RepID=UPI0019198AAB|nr:tellurite resistance TerB family protein [Rubrivivax sp. A210]CAD5372408.1 putative Inner membrane protein YebE [Rubrivivax sp. A210]
MSALSLLQQLLQSGLPAAGTPQRDDLGKYATGAAAGGVLGLLLGSRSGRRLGGKALKYGSVAALGALAWKAYQDYQDRQQPTAAPARAAMPALSAPVAEKQGRALLKAMIAAAKSDGHLDERERGLVEAELGRLQAEPTLRDWVQSELRRPVEPADVAAGATGPESAAEIYLASLLVVDETTTMERAYLDELARQLRLEPGLKAELEARAAG